MDFQSTTPIFIVQVVLTRRIQSEGELNPFKAAYSSSRTYRTNAGRTLWSVIQVNQLTCIYVGIVKGLRGLYSWGWSNHSVHYLITYSVFYYNECCQKSQGNANEFVITRISLNTPILRIEIGFRYSGVRFSESVREGVVRTERSL